MATAQPSIRNSFDPAATHAMGIAFDDICNSLGLDHQRDPMTETIARQVIEQARRGVFDPDKIRAAVLAAHRSE